MSMDTEFAGSARDVSSPRNVSEAERWGSIAAGTALALYGISRRKPSGFMLAALGAVLVRRGARGHCEVQHVAVAVHGAPQGVDGQRHQRV